MTLEELKVKCEAQGFKYAYGVFRESVEPPHLVSICTTSTNFLADNIVYAKTMPIQLDYTYTSKNINEQNKIENNILSNLAWEKGDEIYLSDEEIWQVSYFFEIKGE